MDINGKVALVTGGAGGLGFAFVQGFLRRGAKVCVVDNNQVTLDKSEATLLREFDADRFAVVNCDVTNKQALEDAFNMAEQKLGVIQIVCNNAGTLNEFTPDHTISLNFTAVCYGTMIATERMRKDKGGRGGVVINTASNAGLRQIWFAPVYSATKAAVIGYTGAMSKNPEYTKNGVRYNTVCPSGTDTPLLNDLEAKTLDDAAVAELLNNQIWLTVEYVTAAMMRLIEEDRNGDNILIGQDKHISFATVTFDKTD